MRHVTEFLHSISLTSRAAYHEISFENRRNQLVAHEDRYMDSLFRFHLSSFINGAYTIVSPFTGEYVKSSFTLLSRGGGRKKGERGNTSLFVMWGFIDSDKNLFLIGTMDVFGWMTHFIHPASQTYRVIVPTEDPEWFTPNYSLSTLVAAIEQGLTRPHHINTLDTSERAIFLGTSESAGHAVWNDLSGLYTYYRQASLRGLSITGYRSQFSMLSESLTDEEVKNFIRLDSIKTIQCNIDVHPAFIPNTVFRPLDFALRIQRIRKALSAAECRHSRLTQLARGGGSVHTCLSIDNKRNNSDLRSITLWINVRSPVEVKRGICVNYYDLTVHASKYLRSHHKFNVVNLIIDGWTGKTMPDPYTSIAQRNHMELSQLLEVECRPHFNSVKNIVGLSLLEKLRLSTNAGTQKVMSLCQYGSGIIYGSVLANDMAIVMDQEPYTSIGPGYDALLGRKDIIPECALKVVYLKGESSSLGRLPFCRYHNKLVEIQADHQPNCDYYHIRAQYLSRSIDICLASHSGLGCSYVGPPEQ
jgi:hypothetical protein